MLVTLEEILRHFDFEVKVNETRACNILSVSIQFLESGYLGGKKIAVIGKMAMSLELILLVSPQRLEHS